MLCKIYIEKAFDTMDWKAILAPLQRMLFLDKWITWVQACLSSATFSFLINGNHTSWITGTRGVRQGDLISPLLFLLVSQNLSTILNKAMSLDLVQSFNANLPRNFNHLMFADDLILVTRAFRVSVELFSSTVSSSPFPITFSLL